MAIYARVDADPRALSALTHTIAIAGPAASGMPAPSRQVAPAVIAAPAAAPGAAPSAADVPPEARELANHLGCGDIRPLGDGTFAAQCSDHRVAIDCDQGKCRPTHTIN